MCTVFYLPFAYCDWLLLFPQEHLHVLSDDWLEDRPKPLSVKDQTAINRLEEQAEEFLHAVLCRKGKAQRSVSHQRSVKIMTLMQERLWNVGSMPGQITADFILVRFSQRFISQTVFIFTELKLPFFYILLFWQMCRISPTRTFL